MRFESRLTTASGRARKRVHSQDRRAIVGFITSGWSQHSEMGHFAAVILNYCVQNGVAFELNYMPGGGFYIMRKPLHDKYPRAKILQRLKDSAISVSLRTDK